MFSKPYIKSISTLKYYLSRSSLNLKLTLISLRIRLGMSLLGEFADGCSSVWWIRYNRIEITKGSKGRPRAIHPEDTGSSEPILIEIQIYFRSKYL